MTEKWAGLAAAGDKVTLIAAEIDEGEPVKVVDEHVFRLQKGDRPEAYAVIYQNLSDYIRERKIQKVIIKASASSRQMSKAHLDSAELRGVAMAAAAGSATVQQVAKATISKHFGDRKFDEYLSDNDFWAEQITGNEIKIGSREAALLLVASKGRV